MIDFFPKPIGIRALTIYLCVLTAVSVIFFSNAISPEYMVMGVVSVAGFFFFSYFCSWKWKDESPSVFTIYIFITAFLIRVIAMTALYFYFIVKTGIPFEFHTVDAMGYHLDAEWMASVDFASANTYLYGTGMPLSDSGYLLYLSLLYRFFGPSIYLARLSKCLLDALSCVLVYKMASRISNEPTARIAAIFYCFMPNLIFYCGLHLKEVEMLFLTIAAMERLSYVIHRDRVDILNSVLVAVLIFLLFSFRTVLALSVTFAVASALIFVTFQKRNAWHHVAVVVWVILALGILAGGTITNEISNAWENRVENQITKRDQQTLRGNLWAQYATGTVMAPMMFVIPFPTMVDTDQQYTQQMLHGGNYVRNFLGIFVLIAVIEGLFFRREGQRHVIILSFVVSYLGVVCLSGYSNSERFVLPALPFLLILAANGITHLNEKNYHWVRIWYWIVPLMPLGWAIFKLGSRGLL